MKQISTLIIGAGQAGLAMSHCLSERSVPHVVLERGDIANSWRTERWDSLRLLTPNWQSRLPGYRYTGSNHDGFMDMPDIVNYLTDYAAVSAAPIETRTTVQSVTKDGNDYVVRTNRGDWKCQNLIIASGACNRANIPALAADLPPQITQISALDYRNPAQLPNGGVLVVGASATGVQLADEIRCAGHEVVLAASHHIRVPRQYRGKDIQWWMDQSGLHSTTRHDVDDIKRARSVPSFQLIGDPDIPLMDVNYLQKQGIRIAGKLSAIRDGQALFSGGLANACELSDLKMRRLLATFDRWAEWAGITHLPAPMEIEPTTLETPPLLSLNMNSGQIRTIIWATGFRPDYSWLHLPVFDQKHHLIHDGGHVADGLYVLGLPFMRRRNSALLDGVGADAIDLANHITHQSNRLAA